MGTELPQFTTWLSCMRSSFSHIRSKKLKSMQSLYHGQTEVSASAFLVFIWLPLLMFLSFSELSSVHTSHQATVLKVKELKGERMNEGVKRHNTN
jgi:hypothetical protein